MSTADDNTHQCVVPDAVVAKLAQFEQVARLCDESGRTIGYFLPKLDPALYEPVEPDLSDEELRQIAQSSEWYSTTEVLRHLEGLR